LVANPELVEQPRYAALSAGWFWNKRNLNELADADDILTMTKRINGGTIGIDDRKAKIAKVSNIISS
jgi:putative chitinase